MAAPGSQALTLSGTFEVQVSPAAPLGKDAAEELRGIVEAFVAALRLGMFAPAKLVADRGTVQDKAGAVVAKFDATDLERGHFRVLHGMLKYFELMVEPLGQAIAWRTPQTSGANLLSATAPLPRLTTRIPFRVDVAPGGGVAPPLSVSIEFGRGIAEEDREPLEQELAVWVALVHGGYAPADEGAGHSAIGPLVTRFDDAYTLLLVADAWHATMDCFDSLKNLVAQWHARFPVVALEVE